MSQYVSAACLSMWTPRVVARGFRFHHRDQSRDQSIERMRESHSQGSHRIAARRRWPTISVAVTTAPRAGKHVVIGNKTTGQALARSSVRSTTCASSLGGWWLRGESGRSRRARRQRTPNLEQNCSNEPCAQAGERRVSLTALIANWRLLMEESRRIPTADNSRRAFATTLRSSARRLAPPHRRRNESRPRPCPLARCSTSI
jgi:hypothetical protein